METKKMCKVCGLYYDKFYPWGIDGSVPSHDICDCCGIEFGYEDSDVRGIRNARDRWREDGYKWAFPEKEPIDWNLQSQLKNIPEELK